MSPAVRRRKGNSIPVKAIYDTSGPWKRVVATNKDPFDDSKSDLVNAVNMYIPDPVNGSGIYARPGWTLENNGDPVSHTAGIRGQGVINHTNLAGQSYNFCVFGGKLYRADTQFVNYVDVTPMGVDIDDTATTRIYSCSLGDQLVIHDGVHAPWIATTLDATPIVGTYIDFDGSGTSWAAFGPPRVYGGSMFFVLSQYNSVYARTDIAWSAPGDAATGYQQPTFDFRWTLEQTSSLPINAIGSTETRLFYFRQHSIGALSGPVGPSLQGQATHDALSQNVGTQMPQCVVQYNNGLFFLDQFGRPYTLYDGRLDPIWLQMRGILDDAPLAYPDANAVVASATYEPNLNLYVLAPFTTDVVRQSPPVAQYVYDVKTSNFQGQWTIANGAQIDCMGQFTDPNGKEVLVVLGSLVPQVDDQPAVSGYIWVLNPNAGQGEGITTEDGTLITTEDVQGITTEGTAANWMDGDVVPYRAITTTRMAYGIDQSIFVDRASILVGNTDPIEVFASSASVAQSIQAVPMPVGVQDEVNRATVGFDGMAGRGCSITVSPTTAQSQWSCQAISIFGVTSQANPDEP